MRGSGETPIEDGGRAQVISKIRTLYEDDVPLFTKESIREVEEQIQEGQDGHKVFIRGLDGIVIDDTVTFGHVWPAEEPDLEYIETTPHIRFLPLQHLLSPEGYDPGKAFCSMRIVTRMEKRDRFTKEWVDRGMEPYEKVEAFFNTTRESWESTEACELIRSILTKNVKGHIDKIVGFALGPLSRSLERARWRSSMQHALLLTIRDVFSGGETTSGEIMCHTQDPAYGDVDIAILESHGVAVLDDPKGFLEVDESTAVLSCSPDVAVKEIVSELARPSLIIWNRVREEDVAQLMTDPDSPRVRRMLRWYYESFEFPGAREDFGDLVIYIKRGDESAASAAS